MFDTFLQYPNQIFVHIAVIIGNIQYDDFFVPQSAGNCADRRFLCFCSMTKTLSAHAMSAAETVCRALGLVPAERV